MPNTFVNLLYHSLLFIFACSSQININKSCLFNKSLAYISIFNYLIFIILIPPHQLYYNCQLLSFKVEFRS